MKQRALLRPVLPIVLPAPPEPMRLRQPMAILRPLLSLAAMLLITFGLGVWLTSESDSSAGGSPLELVLASVPVRAMAPLAARNVDQHHEIARVLPAGPKTPLAGPLRVDLEGRSLAGWRKAIREGRKLDRLPPPPRVRLELFLYHPGDRPLHVRIGHGFACRLDLAGKGVLRLLAEPDAPVPAPRQTFTIPPGGSVALSWERLVSVEDGEVEYLYPLKPGDYRLTVSVRVIVWGEGEKPRAVWLPAAGPVTLRVEDIR